MTRMLKRTLVLVAMSWLAGCADFERLPPENQRNRESEPYFGYAEDIEALREVEDVNYPKEPPLMASTASALKAARRLFKRIEFIGMSRAQVLQSLGNPLFSDFSVSNAGMDR